MSLESRSEFLSYKNNILHMENVNLTGLLDSVSSPCYCYSKNHIIKKYKKFSETIGDALICYAVKACPNMHILKIMADLGAGADVVSEGEIRRAMIAGIPANKIVFSGIGKKKSEIQFALQKNIKQLNVESVEEIFLVNEIASNFGIKANIAIRINPDVDAKTFKQVTTGRKCDKFGILIDDIFSLDLNSFKNINLIGFMVHIGSQILDLCTLKDGFDKLFKLVKQYNVSEADVGGGLGIRYFSHDVEPNIQEYANIIKEYKKKYNCNIICEPGRYIVGNSGILLTQILYTKSNKGHNFYIIDAGMNDLLRPSLYGAIHDIIPARSDYSTESMVVDVVGPICESSDSFVQNISLPKMKRGDICAILSAGAYGSSMSNNYLSHLIAPEILIDDTNIKIIKSKQTYKHLFQMENFNN